MKNMKLRLKQLRGQKGLSQKEMAKILNLSTSSIGMYEQGRRLPTYDTLIRYAQLFDVSLDYLITGKE
jgi:transcriptional regulator with XRE-family HTH domain